MVRWCDGATMQVRRCDGSMVRRGTVLGAEAHLTPAGFSEVTLWVLERNTQALDFYAIHGFAVEPGADKTIEAGGLELNEIRLRKQLLT